MMMMMLNDKNADDHPNVSSVFMLRVLTVDVDVYATQTPPLIVEGPSKRVEYFTGEKGGIFHRTKKWSYHVALLAALHYSQLLNPFLPREHMRGRSWES